jgi:hypothetical protein
MEQLKFSDLAVGQKFILAKAPKPIILTKENNKGAVMCICNSKDANGNWCHVNHGSPVTPDEVPFKDGSDEKTH